MHRFLSAWVVLLVSCSREAPVAMPAGAPRVEKPELRVVSDAPSRYETVDGRYLVTVRDNTGSATWACEVMDDEAPRKCTRSRDWFRGKGTYTALVTRIAVGEQPRLVARQTFPADGHERGFEIELSFMSDEIEKPSRLAELHVKRLQKSLADVHLMPAWKMTPSGRPAYVLVNASQRTLSGVTWHANYFGHVEKRVGGRWLRVDRGGFCGTVVPGEPLLPGEQTGSIEGSFIGAPRPFSPGEYRYVLRYSIESAQWTGVPTEIWRSGRVHSHFSELHVIDAPFAISARDVDV